MCAVHYGQFASVASDRPTLLRLYLYKGRTLLLTRVGFSPWSLLHSAWASGPAFVRLGCSACLHDAIEFGDRRHVAAMIADESHVNWKSIRTYGYF